MLNKRKSLPFNNHRKSSDVVNLEKIKSTTKLNETKSGTHDKSEAHEFTSTPRKSIVPALMNTHRKSDADKSLHLDVQEKEPFIKELKEFAGVTIILRTAPNPRAFGNFDGHGRNGLRRKSEFHHSGANIHDKLDHGDKADHAGAAYPVFAAKPDNSAHSSNDTTPNDNHH